VAEPAGAAWGDLDRTARAHQLTRVQRAVSVEPTWDEVADAVWLMSVIGPSAASADSTPTEQPPEIAKPSPATDDRRHPPTPEPIARTPPDPVDLRHVAASTPAARPAPESVLAPVLRVPRSPLSSAAEIVRALRPLHRKVLSRRHVVMDEEATAERAVRDGLWLPITKAATERWLDLTLVIDTGPSMALWRPTIAAFETLLEQLGTFRTIQRRLLDVGSAVPMLRGGTSRASARGPNQLIDPSGRRVLLVLTDGVGGKWRTPTYSAMLARLAGRMPTAVIHLLPQRLWQQNGLNLHRAKLKPPGRLAPNSRWSLALPDAWLELDSSVPPHPGTVPIPVLELAAPWLRRFTQLLVGNIEPVDATVLLAHQADGAESDEDESSSFLSSPRDQVKRFLGRASPLSFRLATLFAAAPISLQAAKLIQEEVIPEADNTNIAEVLGSPLFQPQPDATSDSPSSTITFTVKPGVREELLANARRSETARIVRMVSHIGAFGRTWAALDSPDSTPDPDASQVTASEIAIERIVMKALSGPYLSRAGRLAQAEENQGATTIMSSDMSDAAEGTSIATDPNRPPGPAQETVAVSPPPSTKTSAIVTASHGYASLAPVLGDRLPGDAPPVWGNVPPRNPNFTGRVELLTNLGERLTAGGATAVLPSALHGMGGIGKTQTAVEYIYRHLHEYDVVWWIEAAQATQIKASLTELAQVLGLPGSAEANTAVPAVREALRRGKPFGKWLLVFDAAASPEIVRPFFPTNGPGEILITSRNPDWASVARPLEVATFDRAESVELLRRRGPDIPDGDADRLADTLGDLPLALEQAAAWRAETGMPVEEYLRLFDEKVAEILDTSAPPDYDVSVAAAWNVSFDELSKRSPAAHQLLQVCAFFSPEPIPRYFFTGVRGVTIAPELDKALRDPIQLSRAIRDINRYGLAKIDHRNGTLQLHRLVQLVLRNRMSKQHQAEMKHGAHVLLANADPNDPLAQKEWQRYQDLLPHVYAADMLECDDAWGRQLVLNLINFLYRWGDHDEAINLANLARTRWELELGAKDPQTLEAASRLSLFYWVTGQYTKSAEINLEILEIRRRVDGENSEMTLSTQLSVAGDLRAQGDFAGSARITGEAHQKARALFGDDDPATMRFARHHCISLRLTGQYQQAAELDSDTYQRYVSVLGNDHPETLSALGGLILDRREAGEYLWASAEQEKLALRAQEIHGENNADTLRRFAYLAVARRKAGDHKGALQLSTEVVERFRVRYGQENFNFNMMACILGRSIDLRHAEDLRSAREVGEDVLQIYREKMGEHHPYTYCAIVDLAVTQRLLGDPATARELDERALEQLRAALGPDHVHAITCAINLASDRAAQGDAEAALAIDTDAVERAERTLGVDHPTTLAASLNLVFDLRALGREQDAEKGYADVLSRYRRVLGERHQATVNAAKGIRADCDIDPLPL
jgi:hypothetical protein